MLFNMNSQVKMQIYNKVSPKNKNSEEEEINVIKIKSKPLQKSKTT